MSCKLHSDKNSSLTDEIDIDINDVVGSQTSKSVHWSPALIQTKSINSGSAREDSYMDTDLDKSSSSGPDVSIGTFSSVL